MRCRENGIEHRLAKPKHPRKRSGRKDESDPERNDDQALPLRQPRPTPRTSPDIRERLQLAKRLEDTRRSHTLQAHRPMLANEPERFRLNPTHHMPGLNNQATRMQIGNQLCNNTGINRDLRFNCVSQTQINLKPPANPFERGLSDKIIRLLPGVTCR